jgi:cardiolipin synthase
MVAGAARIGSTVTAAIANRRVLEPIEAHIALSAGAALFILAALAVVFPRGFAYPLAAIAAWFAVALAYRGVTLYAASRRRG